MRALHGSLRLLREGVLPVHNRYGLSAGSCVGALSEMLAREDCLAVASEAVWPEVTKHCD